MDHLPRHRAQVQRQATDQTAPAPQPSDAVLRHFATAQTLLQRSAPKDLDTSLLMALALIGKAMQACRAYVFRADAFAALDNTHEWCADGVKPMQAQLQNVPFSDGDPLWQVFARDGVVAVRDLERTRPESRLRQILDGQQIRALLACAVWNDAHIAGFVGFDFTKGPRDFSKEEHLALRSFAATLSLALQNRDTAMALARTEASLRTTQARLSAAVSRAPRLLVETDAEGIISGFFQSEPMIFALNPNEVIGTLPEQVLPAHVAAIVRRAMQEVDSFGTSATYAYPLALAEGEKWFNLSAASRDPDRAGAQAGYLFLVTDISETRRQELLIRQLGRVAELSNNLIFLTDKDRKITWANPAGLARTGYDATQIVGLCPSFVLQLDQVGTAQSESIRTILLSGRAVTTEVECTSLRGMTYWLDLNIQPLHDPDAGVQGYMVVGVDITAHKLAEARTLRDTMRTLDASGEGYAIFWPDGRVAFLNTELRKLLGLSPDADKDGLLWTDLASKGFTERLITILPELVVTGYWNGEVTLPDRPDLSLDLSLTVQDDGSFFLVVRDITARRQAEAERAKLQAQLQASESRLVMSHMAAGLAHDLANLLSVITGSVSVAESQSPKAAQPALGRIRQASTQAQNLVATLMQFGRARTRRTRIDLSETVSRACEMLSANVASPLDWQIAEADLHAMADPTQVMQVIVNLVMNADQAMAAQDRAATPAQIVVDVDRQVIVTTPGPLALGRLEPGRAYIVTRVTDQGPGIPDTLRDTLFTPFVTAGTQRGTGLGLAIVAHIVTTHGGALRIENRPMGGARIEVYWPVTPVPALDQTALLSDHPVDPLAGLNVLLVDDDDQVLQSLSAILTKAGAETVSCDNPKDAIAALLDDPDTWHVIVTDYDMRPLNGLELAQEVRRIAPRTGIVLVTGATTLQNAKLEALNLDGAILRKPISGPELIAVLLNEKLRYREAPSLE